MNKWQDGMNKLFIFLLVLFTYYGNLSWEFALGNFENNVQVRLYNA